jgi:hypothetical protein
MITRNPKKNSDWDISIVVGEQKESELVGILGDCTMEVKFDRYENDRHFIEYKRISMAGIVEPTGISVTKASHYALCKPHYYLIVSTERLKRLMKWAWGNRKPIMGGDGKRTFAMMLTESEILGWKDDNA